MQDVKKRQERRRQPNKWNAIEKKETSLQAPSDRAEMHSACTCTGAGGEPAASSVAREDGGFWLTGIPGQKKQKKKKNNKKTDKIDNIKSF